jgi:hypothetical protein
VEGAQHRSVVIQDLHIKVGSFFSGWQTDILAGILSF